MLERERPRVPQDPGVHELLAESEAASASIPASRAAVTSGAVSSTATLRASAGRPVAEPRERLPDRVRDGVRPVASHGIRVVVAQPIGQPADQQRVATGGAVARLHKGLGHRAAVAVGEHARRSRPATAARAGPR